MFLQDLMEPDENGSDGNKTTIWKTATHVVKNIEYMCKINQWLRKEIMITTMLVM